MKKKNTNLINYVEQIWNYTYNENLEGLKQLQQYTSNRNIDVNIIDNIGLYPINYAVAYQNKDIIAFFLANNARMDIIDGDGLSILHHPIKWNNIEIMRLLLNFSKQSIGLPIYNIVDKNGNTPITYCLRYKKIECLEMLLAYDCDILTKDSNGDSMLQQVIKYNNNLDYIKALISLEVFNQIITFTNINEETILHTLIIHDIKFVTNDYIQLLNSQDKDGITPLMLAILKDNMAVVNSFLAYPELKINISAYDANTALHMAIYQKNEEIIEKMLKCPTIRLNAMNVDYDTPFMALIKNFSDIYKYKNIYNLIDFNELMLNKFGKDKITTYELIKQNMPQYIHKITPAYNILDISNKETAKIFINFEIINQIESWNGNDFDLFSGMNYVLKTSNNKIQSIYSLIPQLYTNNKLQNIFDTYQLRQSNFTLNNCFFWWINNHLIVPENLSFNDIFVKHSFRFTILPLKVLDLQEVDAAHLNLIIIHHKHKIIWRYDPYGSKSPILKAVNTKILDQQIKKKFHSLTDKFIIEEYNILSWDTDKICNYPIAVQSTIGLQYRELIENGEFRLKDENKNCGIWCFLYIYYLVHYEDNYEKLMSKYFPKCRNSNNYTFEVFINQSIIYQDYILKKVVYSFLCKIHTERLNFLNKYNISIHDISYITSQEKLNQINKNIIHYLNDFKTE